MGFCTDLELGRFKDDKNLGFHRNLAKLETPLHCLKPCFELLAIGKRHASDLGCRYIRSRNWSGRESFAATLAYKEPHYSSVTCEGTHKEIVL